MRKSTSKSIRYGDYGLRQPFAGKSPDQIRRELAAAARASIRR